MDKYLTLLCSICTLSLSTGFSEPASFVPQDVELSAPTEKKVPRKSPIVKAAFSPFTGKVRAANVRMRLQPDVESHVVKELAKDELLSVVGQEGEFYSVSAPDSVKAYVFRSFILDNIVEGNRVNVRLEPDLEAPIIGHLNSGDRVEGQVCDQNKKWLEIQAPNTTYFYVAKNYIENMGAPELKEQLEKRKVSAVGQLEATALQIRSELERPFDEIRFELLKEAVAAFVRDYSDFSEQVDQVKEILVKAQEIYLEKKATYLEQKANGTLPAKTDGIASLQIANLPITWDAVERGLYATWAEANQHRSMTEYYDEERLVATTLSGTLEPYKTFIRNRPGDYILKRDNLPVAYVYATKVNLGNYVGKKVTLVGSQRDSHHFAFPSYFVHEVEE